MPFYDERVVRATAVDDEGEHAGYGAMRDLLRLDPAPDGVYCHNDPTALGAIRAILKSGRDVPRDSHEQKLHSRAARSAELQAGDLIFLTDDETSDRITHVMIFTGGDGLIESRKSSGRVLRTTFLERFGQPLTSIESGDAVSDVSFARPRRRRVFFGSYF